MSMKGIDPTKDEISKEVADKPEGRLNTFDDRQQIGTATIFD